MRAPESLQTLIEYGIIQEVIRPLMSGKEAQVFIVVSEGVECVAKVYKEAMNRTFKHRSDYTEGRKTRNTRDQRAINKRSQHGRKKDEDAWRSTEVDMIYRLRDAGVRVPEPMNFVEGVLVMELVKDAHGEAAPRLGDLDYSPAEAKAIYDQLLKEVVRMLAAGVIHGDLSDFNVLMAGDGPVVIDFPQSIDPTHNPNGEKLLLRDVENLHRFLTRFAPEEEIRPYGQEIWKLFQANKLRPDTKLTGVFAAPEGKVNTNELIGLIEEANKDEARRRAGPKTTLDDDDEFEAARDALAAAPPTFRKVVDFSQERKPRPAARSKAGADAGQQNPARQRRRSRRGGDAPGRSETAASASQPRSQSKPQATSQSAASHGPAREGRRRRRSRTGRSDRGEADSRGGEQTASPKSPPSGPRAMREKEPSRGSEGASADRAGASRRPRNRRRRGGAAKSGSEQEPRSASTPGRSESTSTRSTRAPSGSKPGATARQNERPHSRRSSGESAGRDSAPNDSASPAKRRRRRRPRKPESE